MFPSLSNISLDQSSFFFNLFEIILDDDVEEFDEFHPFPNQEQLIQDSVLPLKEIIGDISSKNIMTHSQRGVPAESFNSTLLEDDTLTYSQVMALSDKDNCMTAVVKEKDNMADYEVWDFIERTPVEKPINCTWVFKIKPESSNQAQEYKAQLCVQGFKEVYGKYYNMMFAPTSKLVSLCLLITFALKHKFHQIAVKCAFLNAPIRERITFNPPPGIDFPSNQVPLLKKALWLKKSSKRMASHSFLLAFVGWF
jgi:hypothetical protein